MEDERVHSPMTPNLPFLVRRSRLARSCGRIALAGAVAFVLCAAGPATVTAQEATPLWPSKVVRMEDLKPLTPFRLTVNSLITKGKVIGPTSLRVHVTRSGEVDKISLIQSCGNTELDESVILAMRRMKFEPHLHDGIPVEVTLAVPVHVPKELGRTR
jgi:TonB family protein